MHLDGKSEELFLKFLDPRSVMLPSEIHELSRALLDAYRRQTADSPLKGENSFFNFMSEIMKKYYRYAEEIVVERKVKVTESGAILKWWKEIMAVPSIQGVLLSTPYSAAAPILKLAIITGYFVKEKWNKRSLRELIKAISSEVREDGSLQRFSEKIEDYEASMWRRVVESADEEVEELAIILEKARRKVYWRVKEEHWIS